MEMIQKVMALLMSLLMSFLASIGLVKPQNAAISLSYGTEASQVMDVYLPNGAESKQTNAAVLVLHDGFFASGSKSDLKSTCESITSHGYIAVAMDYRLLKADTKAVTVYTVLDDMTKAIQKLKDYSAENKLNITKIGLSGDSAGGYYAMMYAYSRIIYSPIPIVFVSARVAPSDMNYAQWKGFYTDQQYIDMINLLGGTSFKVEDLASNNATLARAQLYLSPVYYLTRASVPTLFAYAPKDTVVPFANKDALEKELTACGVVHDYIEYSNAGHDLGSVWNNIVNVADFSDQLVNYCNRYFG